MQAGVLHRVLERACGAAGVAGGRRPRQGRCRVSMYWDIHAAAAIAAGVASSGEASQRWPCREDDMQDVAAAITCPGGPLEANRHISVMKASNVHYGV